jgi:hypothetical protein
MKQQRLVQMREDYLTSNLDVLVQNVSARQAHHPVMRPQVH